MLEGGKPTRRNASGSNDIDHHRMKMYDMHRQGKYYKNIVFQYVGSNDLVGRNVSLINTNDETIATGTITDTDLRNLHADSTITINNQLYKSEFEYIQFHDEDASNIINQLNNVNFGGGKRVSRSKTRKAKKTKRRKSNRRKSNKRK